MSINKTGALGGVNRVIQDSGGKITRGPGPQLMSTGRLTGEKVIDARNDYLGKIEEIMFDVPRGILPVRLFPVAGSWAWGKSCLTLTLDADNECFVLNIDKESLERARGVTRITGLR